MNTKKLLGSLTRRELYLVALRFVASMVLFVYLAKANIWLKPLTATLLVLGYRSALIFCGQALRSLGSYALAAACLMGVVGSVLWLLHFELAAVILLGLGLAAANFLLKANAAQTTSGAAWAYVAMNAGSLGAGAVIALMPNSEGLLLSLGAALLFLCSAASILSVPVEFPKTTPAALWQGGFAKNLGWGGLGIATGILVFSIFSILPQAILRAQGELPPWYGWLISLNALIIVMSSVPLTKSMQGSSVQRAMRPLALGLGLLLLPCFMSVQNPFIAFVWVCAISLAESALSYLDYLAGQADALLIKEAAFGIGAAACVYFSRTDLGETGILIVVATGIAALLPALMIGRYRERQTKIHTIPNISV